MSNDLQGIFSPSLDAFGLAKYVLMIFIQEEHLLKIKKEVESKFETEKWTQIAGSFQLKRGDIYSAAAAQKKMQGVVEEPC